jgi:hypothetical protein
VSAGSDKVGDWPRGQACGGRTETSLEAAAVPRAGPSPRGARWGCCRGPLGASRWDAHGPSAASGSCRRADEQKKPLRPKGLHLMTARAAESQCASLPPHAPLYLGLTAGRHVSGRVMLLTGGVRRAATAMLRGRATQILRTGASAASRATVKSLPPLLNTYLCLLSAVALLRNCLMPNS